MSGGRKGGRPPPVGSALSPGWFATSTCRAHVGHRSGKETSLQICRLAWWARPPYLVSQPHFAAAPAKFVRHNKRMILNVESSSRVWTVGVNPIEDVAVVLEDKVVR